MARRTLRETLSTYLNIKDDSGAVAVEFAMMAPVMILLMLGIMAFALHFSILTAVIHAASEGARASIGGLTDADRKADASTQVQAIFQSYGSLLSASNVTESSQAVSLPGSGLPGYAVTVTYNPSGLGTSSFFSFWSWVTGTTQSEQGITYTATVANGGY